MTGLKGAAFWAGAVLVAALFALPLLVGLNEPEMRSDEAIYSYAVERILDTGHWLTPRSIPTDAPFLEKPPLKFWIVAAGIKSGLLPNNDAGLRWFDGLFGAIGFLYVFLIGNRLAGPTCGVIAVLVLFTLDPLLFEHGLRSNNMEASVFLCYCGGMYHFIEWVESAPGRARRLHPWAVAAYFVLGFMTKDVAALFLPMVGVTALTWRRGGGARLLGAWRDWLLPVAAAVAVIAPWFIYESRLFGEGFWHIILGTHVYQRFTSWLDPAHLHPWHYYFSATWAEIGYAGTRIIVAAGIVRLAVAAIRGESWTARVVLLWGALPLVLISIGTSKLLHYAYPFWPPIGLAAGLLFAWALHEVGDAVSTSLGERLGRLIPRRLAMAATGGRRARIALLAVAALLAVIALWTAFVAPVHLEIGNVVLFRNSTFLRPAFAAVVLFWLAGQSRTLLRLALAFALVFLLPVTAYMDKIHRIGRVDHPIRAARDCIDALEARDPAAARGVMNASGDVLHHSYYYYLWRTGPWISADHFSLDDTLARLTTPGRQAPVLIARADYDALRATLPPQPGPGAPPANGDPVAELRRTLTVGAVTFDDNIAMLLPGPFQACAAPMLAADGKPIWRLPQAGRR
ncbi:MAG TPA: hypothetical protein VLT86_19930 [Vicinamibacterales bacterium]|nr:hypothetical protein [Vicinamibacterales bacterium]